MFGLNLAGLRARVGVVVGQKNSLAGVKHVVVTCPIPVVTPISIYVQGERIRLPSTLGGSNSVLDWISFLLVRKGRAIAEGQFPSPLRRTKMDRRSKGTKLCHPPQWQWIGPQELSLFQSMGILTQSFWDSLWKLDCVCIWEWYLPLSRSICQAFFLSH